MSLSKNLEATMQLFVFIWSCLQVRISFTFLPNNFLLHVVVLKDNLCLKTVI